MKKKPRGWVKLTRASGLVEFVCPHGVGHPSSASVEAMVAKTGQKSWGVHGCDGCCVASKPEEGA